MQPAAGAGEAAASQDGRLSTLQPSAGELAEAGPPSRMVLHSSSCIEEELRHVPLLMLCAYSTENMEVVQHRRGEGIPQPLLAVKGQGERPRCPKVW